MNHDKHSASFTFKTKDAAISMVLFVRSTVSGRWLTVLNAMSLETHIKRDTVWMRGTCCWRCWEFQDLSG